MKTPWPALACLLVACATPPPPQRPPSVAPPAPLPPPPPRPEPPSLDLGGVRAASPEPVGNFRVDIPPLDLDALLPALPAPRAAALRLARQRVDAYAAAQQARAQAAQQLTTCLEGQCAGLAKIKQTAAQTAQAEKDAARQAGDALKALTALEARPRDGGLQGAIGWVFTLTALRLRSLSSQAAPPGEKPAAPGVTGARVEIKSKHPGSLAYLFDAGSYAVTHLELAATLLPEGPTRDQALVRAAAVQHQFMGLPLSKLEALEKSATLPPAERAWVLRFKLARTSPQVASFASDLEALAALDTPSQPAALHGLAVVRRSERRFRDALALDLRALDSLERHKNDAPELTPPVLGASAADSLLRASAPPRAPAPTDDAEATLPTSGAPAAPGSAAPTFAAPPPAPQSLSALDPRELTALPPTTLGPLLGATIRLALERHDLSTAEQAATLLLGRAPESLEAPLAIHVQLRLERSRSQLEQARRSEARLAAMARSPWADALRKGRGKGGYPDDNAIQGALTASLVWPAAPRANQTPWQAAAPPLHALVTHCSMESPDTHGELLFTIRQPTSSALAPTLSVEASPSAPLTACLERDAYAFLRGLTGSDWEVRVKASLTTPDSPPPARPGAR